MRFLSCIAALILSLWALPGCAEEAMDQARLHSLLQEHAENVNVNGNLVRLTYGRVDMLCISDQTADRMRIIAPIALVQDVEPQMLLAAMAANFHSVLDARYAIGDGTVYAAFIHPLSPMTDSQVLSALRQVASANRTFGTDYSSGELLFPGGSAVPERKTPDSPL